MRKPFYKRSHKCWYVYSAGKMVRLDEDEEKAYIIWREMVEAGCPESPAAPVSALVESFLLHCAGQVEREELKVRTLDGYGWWLSRFCNAHKSIRVRELRPYHVTRWLDENPSWGNASRRAAITALKRCFNWGVAEGIIIANPIARMKRPAETRRDVLIDDAGHAKMMTLPDGGRGKHWRRAGAFRAVLIALRHTGVRPGMIGSLTAENVAKDFSCWIFPEHKTKRKTGRPLVVYLSPCLQTLTRSLVAARPSGPIFLNERGTPWTSNAIRCRMRRMRERAGLPAGSVAYSYRHTYTTNALQAGTDPAVLAELLGHSDLKMIQQHYGHLYQRHEHLKQAAADAVKRTG